MGLGLLGIEGTGFRAFGFRAFGVGFSLGLLCRFKGWVQGLWFRAFGFRLLGFYVFFCFFQGLCCFSYFGP